MTKAPRILITGASGFVGGRVAAAATTAQAGPVRLLVRGPLDPPAAGPGSAPAVETVRGDLRDPGSLRRACEGADVLIHCASAIGGDEETARAVNDEGTRALVDAAVRAGVTRIVALSTASVHGRGPFRAAAPGTLPIAPVSATSRTRAAGDRHVMEAGGTVLRPHLVYGTGDRQLLPGLVKLLGALPGPLVGGTSLHSLIEVGSLARALLAAALSPHTRPGPYHVNHPDPVPVGELIAVGEELLAHRAGPRRGAALGVAEARALLAAHPFAVHHLDMLAVDHWFSDDRPWREPDRDPGPGFAEGVVEHLEWYRNTLDPVPAAGHRTS
ncbi:MULTISPECIES: NAD-dependent epimerase/dehydratase family protein [unclassified Streptomyces]|uniref:NAD-dependent epimerase/dehydratase family protein n=1 Tax=unclassified Streptomyces TaxID=2593676 RepID=UPI0006AF2F01|nr:MULTISPECIES: NAD-dependent epimerase/dehydratase family protein [unclassified Streptomyces]KOX25608.1 epimerase [Streptomyces sp. NRRL F-6491]KOX48952.1 epimerase [Streptomyces sp. NRRL F-6492]